MAKKIRWGIVGTGRMAHQFAEGLGALEDTEITAVSSRTKGAAEKFAEEFGVPGRNLWQMIKTSILSILLRRIRYIRTIL